MQLRPITPSDLDAVLSLNDAEVPAVNAIDRYELTSLVQGAEFAALAVDTDGAIAGFVIALPPGLDYRSPNYRFFGRRGGDFVYIDRVVVAPAFRRHGVARRLYDAVDEHARTTGRREVTCEVNLRPPNPVSLAFHLGRGFTEVGRQDTKDGEVRVLLLARRIVDDEVDTAAPPSLTLPVLDEATVPSTPTRLLREWIDAAIAASVSEPTGMALATAGEDGNADVRMVLVRGVGSQGVRFFTNRRSPKGRQLAERPYAAGVLYWDPLGRQVRLRGPVEMLDDEDSDAYFASRPRDAQIGAWASDQSTPVANRAALEDRIAQAAKRFSDAPIPRPDHWGGYLIRPDVVEFWAARPARMHDRLRYTRTDDGWGLERLQP